MAHVTNLATSRHKTFRGKLVDEPVQAEQRELLLEIERERASLPLAKTLNDTVKNASVTYARLSE